MLLNLDLNAFESRYVNRYANEATPVNQTCRKDQLQVPKMGAQLLTLSIFLDTCRLVAQLQIYASVALSLSLQP